MIELKSLIEEPERLNEILENEVCITPKYFGNSILANFSIDTFYKKTIKTEVDIVDILASDLYSKPITYLRTISDRFGEGIWKFTNNYKDNRIICLDHIDNEPDDGVNDMNVASLGAFIIRVHKDETVAIGDLLSSKGDGTAKVQADDIMRSKTIAKVTSTNKSHIHADDSYCVPCTLHCG